MANEPDDRGAAGSPSGHPGEGAAASTAASPPSMVEHTIEFRADGQEYFRIWIVNLALTIATLGIYSAWAVVRKRRYFYASTSLAGSAFGYHGDPKRILKGRLIAAGLGAVYFGATRLSPIAGLAAGVLLGLAMPWLTVKSQMFALRNSSWRGIRFSFSEDYAGAYKVLIGWLIAGMLTVGVLLPRAMRERYVFIVTRSRFGDTAFDCKAGIGRFYKTAFAALGLAFLVMIPTVALAAGIFHWATKGAPPSRGILMSIGLVPYLFLLPIVGGYTQSRNLNEVFNRTTLGPHHLRSKLRARALMGLYFTNILGIVATLGLFTPWAEVRLRRYRLGALTVEAHGSIDDMPASVGGANPSATGEEISHFFDVDFGL